MVIQNVASVCLSSRKRFHYIDDTMASECFAIWKSIVEAREGTRGNKHEVSVHEGHQGQGQLWTSWELYGWGSAEATHQGDGGKVCNSIDL